MTTLGDFRDHHDNITGGTSEQEQRHSRIAKLNMGLQLPRGINTGADSVATSSALQRSVRTNESNSDNEVVEETIVDAQLVEEMPTAKPRYGVSYDQFRRANAIAGKDLGRVTDVVQMLSESFSKNPESGIDRE